MKTLLKLTTCVVCLFFLTYSTLAQQAGKKTEEAKTKLETFQAKTGSVVIKSYSSIESVTGRLGEIAVDALELRDATSGLRVLGITINVKEAGRLEREDTSFIDYDEIESL